LKRADIVHFHILADENILLGPIRVKDYIRGKILIHHHHGHPDFRAQPQKYRDKYHRLKRRTLVSTPDLLKLLPEAAWQPNIVPIHAPLYGPSTNGPNGKVRICQSPTRKDLKNTVEFSTVIDRLKQRHKNLKGVIIENTRHRDCLRIKQSCDIHFDHMQGYFGVASLEGLSQAKPVLAGLDDWNIHKICDFTGIHSHPWILARTMEDLERKLERFILEPDRRESCGRVSRIFMEKSWSEERIARTLIRFYQSL
jgi:hypothetical protein